MGKILLADDDEALIANLAKWLQDENHNCDVVFDGNEAIAHLKAFEYDAIILDWTMPGVSGLEVCKQFRAWGGNTPVLMLTGKDDVEHKMIGLDGGADDYLTKPFHFKELAARLRAMLRRPQLIAKEKITVRDLVCDTTRQVITQSGKELQLRPMEYKLLEFLMKNPGQMFSPDMLIRRIWDSDAEVSHYALYSCIKRLREKVSSSSEAPLIVSTYGRGYKLEP